MLISVTEGMSAMAIARDLDGRATPGAAAPSEKSAVMPAVTIESLSGRHADR